MASLVTCFLFLAEPFGFGPISSSIAIARKIKMIDPSKKCLFIGQGTSYQLAGHSGIFDKILFADELSPDILLSCQIRLSHTNCLIIANTYPNGVSFAKRTGFRCVYVDTLFWMWSSLPINLTDVEKYYIEDFHCVDLDRNRFGNSTKFQVTSPLIDISIAQAPTQGPSLIVSLGGIDSSLYDFPVFYEKLIAHISGDEKLSGINILICGGGKRFRENDFRKYEHFNLTISCLNPLDYIAHLKSADIVIASAGLHSFYENYFLKKNVMFLPPQSYSQYLQLKYILANFEGVQGTNFEQLGLAHTLRENMPDLERINEVKRTNQQLIQEEIFENFLKVFERFHSGAIRTDWKDEKNKPKVNQDGPFELAKDILSHVKQ